MAALFSSTTDTFGLPVAEGERLAILRALEVLDTPAERAFDELTQAAARLCGAPMAAVSLVDHDRQWFKARVGLDIPQTPRDVSFCTHAMWKDEVFVVTDAASDPLFAGSPLVTDEPGLRFYAGAPIRSAEGAPLGTLCVMGNSARPEGLMVEQAMVLRVLANQVEAQLQLRQMVQAQARRARAQAVEIAIVHDREARLLKALASADLGWWDWDVEADRAVANAEIARILGLDPEVLAKGAPIASFFANIHPGDRRALRDAIDHAVTTGEPFQEECRVQRPDGEVLWVSARGRALRDPDMGALSFPGVAMDITAQKLIEDRVRDADMGRELALDAARLGRWDHKPHTGERFFDARALQLLGMTVGTADEIEAMVAQLHPDDRAMIDAARERVLDPRRSGLYRVTFRLIRPSGEERWISAVGRTQFTDGVCTRFLGVMEDVTDTKRADKHRRLLVNELNHRVKNTLTLVQSLVDFTLRNATDFADTRAKLAARIQALARAHDQLTATNWSAADVSQVVEGLLSSLSLPRERFEVVGAAARLGPQPALQLSLALHELATNALKYGALSNDTGRVRIEWALETGLDATLFTFGWTERGGPTVTAPTRRGFGSQLIERATAAAFAGEVALDYDPGGVRWRIVAPYAGLAESGRAPLGEE